MLFFRMMDTDIKLFLKSIGYNSFEGLTKKELCGCFDYAGTNNFNIPVWGEIRKKAYNNLLQFVSLRMHGLLWFQNYTLY
jgi:hypothetical protein